LVVKLLVKRRGSAPGSESVMALAQVVNNMRILMSLAVIMEFGEPGA